MIPRPEDSLLAPYVPPTIEARALVDLGHQLERARRGNLQQVARLEQRLGDLEQQLVGAREAVAFWKGWAESLGYVDDRSAVECSICRRVGCTTEHACE